MPDENAVGTVAWWLDKLDKQLTQRQRDLQVFDDYYEGNHRLAFATTKFRSAFGDLFSAFADNWCDLVVDAVEERLNVEGFRLGTDPAGDRKAWAMWQANQLDADSQIAHTEALIFGESYVMVWACDNPKVPEITIESPLEMTVAMVPGCRGQRAAAFKRWRDEDGFDLATLYLPDGLYKFRSATKRQQGMVLLPGPTSWERREVPGEAWPLPNPLGVVPVVPLVNRPRLLKPGVSEIKRVIPLQDAVNKMIADMLVASEFGAAPQRWATGLEIPKDPATGQPLQMAFDHMVNRFWTSKAPTTQFGQFRATDLTNFTHAIELIVQHIASQTRTPPHYFYLSGQFPSGESIKSAETGLVAKAHRKMRHFGEAWEEVMSLGFAVVGDAKRASVQNSEVIWGDPESRSEAQHIDAVIKRKILGVPDEQLWEDAGYTPTQIERFKQLRAASAATGEVPVEPTEAFAIRA